MLARRSTALRLGAFLLVGAGLWYGGTHWLADPEPPQSEPGRVQEAVQPSPEKAAAEPPAKRRSKASGFWVTVEPRGLPPEGSVDAEEEQRLLKAIGYAAGTEIPRDRFGVSIHDRDRAEQGLNLVVLGHAPLAVLMDMDGQLVHRWTFPSKDIFPDGPQPTKASDHFWRRVRLLEDGSLLVIIKDFALFKLDAESKLVWANDCRPHHDLDLDETGRIYALTRRVVKIPDIHPDKPAVEDFITLLDAEGTLLRSVSLIDCFRNSGSMALLEERLSPKGELIVAGDILHTNTLTYIGAALSEASPLAAEGNLLVCFRNIHLIGLVDFELETLTWTTAGDWRMQHEPVLLPSGNIILFDNRGVAQRSSVTEFEPFSGDVVWRYRVDTDNAFYSSVMGAVSRLPGGNTLVTESTYGRVFELTPDKQIVWEYVSPHRTGPNNERVAVVPEVVRLPADFPVDWLSRPGH